MILGSDTSDGLNSSFSKKCIDYILIQLIQKK